MIKYSLLKKTLFVLLGIGLLSGLQAQDCPCDAPPEPVAASAAADIIFVGKVIRVNTNWMSGGMKFTFEVEQYWKHRVDQYFVVNSGWEERECGYLFESGKRYLVFAKKKFSAKTDRCAGNLLLEEATPIPAVLGPGNPPSSSPALPGMYLTLAVTGLLSVLFVAFVVLRKRLFHKK